MKIYYDQIRIMERELETIKDKYLLTNGWSKSNQYVDNVWRWDKYHLKGMSTSDAISCQKYYDEYGEENKE